MTKPSPVTLAYVDSQPSSAANDLSILPAGDAASFLETIPHRYAVSVLGFASSWSCAAILEHLPKTVGASMLRDLSFRKSVEILRLMPAERREEIIGATPRRLRRDYERSLSYPSDTVGAVMTIDALAVRPERTVNDVLNELRTNQNALADTVFVVSDDHRLVGAVTPLDLVRSMSTAAIGDVMDASVASISARSRVSSIVQLDAWDKFSVLPVLSRRDHLVGALRRQDIAGDTEEFEFGDGDHTSIVGALLAAFVHSGVEFSRLIAGSRPSRQPTQQRGG